MEYLARLRQFRQKITLKTWNPHFKSFYRQNRSCHWLEIFSVCSKCKSHKAHTISASYDYSFYFFFYNFSKIWHLKSEIRVHSVPQGVDHLCIKGDISIDPPPYLPAYLLWNFNEKMILLSFECPPLMSKMFNAEN